MSDRGTPDVFVSYSSKNKNVADAVVTEFESHGFKCWYAPRDIMPGESWVSAITDALQKVKVQILIYTDESNASRQVMNEVAVAFNDGKTIVPFRLTQTKMSGEFEYYLARVHWFDAVEGSLDDNITQLRKYVEAILSGDDGAVAAGMIQQDNVRTVPKKRTLPVALIACCVAAFFLVMGIVAFMLKNSGADDGTAVADSYVPEADTEIDTDIADGDMNDEEPADVAGDEAETSEDTTEEILTADATEDTAGDGEDPGEDIGSDEPEKPEKDETSDETVKEKPKEDNTKEDKSAEDSTVPKDTGDKPKPEKTADAGDGDTTTVAESEPSQRDVSEMSVKELEKAARKGDVAACDELGDMYYLGDGVERDFDKAQLYLTRAVENGSTSVRTYKRLGDMYYYGQGVEESDSEAEKYYKKAIDLGYEDVGTWSDYAMILYRDDRYDESAKYFVKAAKSSKNAMIMYNAGLAYYGAEDYDSALEWMGKAIDNGYERKDDAKKMIKSMVENGLISEEDAEGWI